MKKLFLPLIIVIAVVSIAGNFFAYFRYSSSRPLIIVNSVPITRKQYQDRVDALYSKPILSSMIWNQIIMQAAAKNHCLPTSDDVDNVITQLMRSNPSVVENAKRTDPDLTLFKESVMTNLAVRNLRMVGITATPDEVQAFYLQHKKSFQLPLQVQTTLVIAKSAVDAATAQRLLLDNVSNSVIESQPGLGIVGVNVKLSRPLPSSVGKQVMTMKPGDVKVIPIGQNYAIVKIKGVAAQGVPDLSKIQDQVRIACVLSKAPSEQTVLSNLRSSAQITADVSKYADAIPQLPSASSPAAH